MRRGPCSSDRRRRPAACAASIATRRSRDAMVGSPLTRRRLATTPPPRRTGPGRGGAGWAVSAPVRAAIRQRRGRVRDAGADYLAYLLLDAVVDAYFPVLERVIESVEALEDGALDPLPGS